MRFFIATVLALSISAPAAFAAPRNRVLECQQWVSKRNFIRIRINRQANGSLRASFNNGDPINMNAFTVPVQLTDSQGDYSTTYEEVRASSSISQFNLYIVNAEGEEAESVSPIDGQTVVGNPGQAIVKLDIERADGSHFGKTIRAEHLVCTGDLDNGTSNE